MKTLFANPYNVNPTTSHNFSDSYFDKVTEKFINPLAVVVVESSADRVSRGADINTEIDFLWDFMPIDPEFKIGCNVEQAKNVLRYLVETA